LRSGLPGRYEPFCRERVADKATSYQIYIQLNLLNHLLIISGMMAVVCIVVEAISSERHSH
jgi:hypothetical protein